MQEYILIDVMDCKSDIFICTLKYPKPPLYPLFPLDKMKVVEFVQQKKPTLKSKSFTAHVGDIKITKFKNNLISYDKKRIC